MFVNNFLAILLVSVYCIPVPTAGNVTGQTDAFTDDGNTDATTLPFTSVADDVTIVTKASTTVGITNGETTAAAAAVGITNGETTAAAAAATSPVTTGHLTTHPTTTHQPVNTATRPTGSPVDIYATCTSSAQSPINLDMYSAVYMKTLDTLDYTSYFNPVADNTTVTLSNDGFTVRGQVNYATGNSSQYHLSGGGLPSIYVLDSFVLHWGLTNNLGSEHSLLFDKFPVEMQMLHYRQDLGSMSAAQTVKNGVAALGVLFELSESDNHDLDDVFKNLADIRYKGNSVTVGNFTPSDFLPANRNLMYRYTGSGTLPPACNASVIWTVFDDELPISITQLNLLRSLWSNTVDEYPVPLGSNYRRTQPLNGRTVYRSTSNEQPATRTTGAYSVASSLTYSVRVHILVAIIVAISLGLLSNTQ